MQAVEHENISRTAERRSILALFLLLLVVVVVVVVCSHQPVVCSGSVSVGRARTKVDRQYDSGREYSSVETEHAYNEAKRDRERGRGV